MFRYTITIALAVLCLTKSSLSKPIPKSEKGKPLDIDAQVPGLDIGVKVGCGDNVVDVNVNSIHLPLIPCTNTQTSIQTPGAKLPLIRRNLDLKREDPPPSPNITGPLMATDSSIPSFSSSTTSSTSISLSSIFIGPLTAIDSLIPQATSTDILVTSIEARKLHTHHRTLATNPPHTIIIEPLPVSTRLPKKTHTHHRLSKTSVHPHPLPAQTLTERRETKKKPLTTETHTFKPTFTWISPPQTRFPLPPIGLRSTRKSTTLETKVLESTSTKSAKWHPPADSLYPPPVELERGEPNKGW